MGHTYTKIIILFLLETQFNGAPYILSGSLIPDMYLSPQFPSQRLLLRTQLNIKEHGVLWEL